MLRLEELQREHENENRKSDRRIQGAIAIAAFLTIAVNVLVSNCGQSNVIVKNYHGPPATAVPSQ